MNSARQEVNRNINDFRNVHNNRSERNVDYYSSNNYFSRLTKVDFPKFRGEELASWLYKVEQFFHLDRTPDMTKSSLAAVHFEDKALQWYYTFMQQ